MGKACSPEFASVLWPPKRPCAMLGACCTHLNHLSHHLKTCISIFSDYIEDSCVFTKSRQERVTSSQSSILLSGAALNMKGGQIYNTPASSLQCDIHRYLLHGFPESSQQDWVCFHSRNQLLSTLFYSLPLLTHFLILSLPKRLLISKHPCHSGFS